MKKYYVLALTLLMGFSTISAETEKTVGRGSELSLTAEDGYTSYQWQFSSDGQVFTNIDGATSKDLTTKVFAPGHYRVVAKKDGSSTNLSETKVSFSEFTSTRTDEGSAAQGYCEINGKAASGINIPGDGRNGWDLTLTNKLTNWTNASASAVYFFNQTASTTDVKMKLKVTNGAKVRFRITVSDPDAPTTPIGVSYVTLKGTGAEQIVDVFSYKFPANKYYRYQIDCLEGNTSINYIDRFVFASDGDKQITPAAYLSSPSVHLGGWQSTASSAPKGHDYDWVYEEVMLPEESDIIGTYTMSLGVLNGYMGIQVNGTTDHSIIFSTWDNGTTDGGKTLRVDSMAAHVDWNSNLMSPNRFGGEGSGVQCLLHGNLWTPGKYIRFLSNARPTTKTYSITNADGTVKKVTKGVTLVTAWFDANDGKGWQYIATLRHPHKGELFDSWYSFLENYNWPSGEMQRRSYYRNGFAHYKSGKKWYHFNKISGSHTDGGSQRTARADYGHGQVTDREGMKDTFVMWTGGYNTTQKNSETVPLQIITTVVDSLKLSEFEKRVDLAVQHEAEREAAADSAAAERADWKMVSFSSEETSGEGTNGRAALIIDGQSDTYWTNAWKSGSSSLPHNFVIDFGGSKAYKGFDIVAGDRADRRVKSVEFYVSDDNKTFRKVYSNVACPAQTSYSLKFDSIAHGRYVKMVITASYSGGKDTRLYDITPIFDTTQTGIVNVSTNTLSILAINEGANLKVVTPENTDKIDINLYGMNGQSVRATTGTNKMAGEANYISLDNLPAGIYLLRAQANGKQYCVSVKK